MLDQNAGEAIIRNTLDSIVDTTPHNVYNQKNTKGCEKLHPISKLPKDIGNNPIKIKNQNPTKDDTKNNRNPPNKVDNNKHKNNKK